MLVRMTSNQKLKKADSMNLFVEVTRNEKNNTILVELVTPLKEEVKKDVLCVIQNVQREFLLTVFELSEERWLIECGELITMDLVFDRIKTIADVYKNQFRYSLERFIGDFILGLCVSGIVSGFVSDMDFVKILSIILGVILIDNAIIYSKCKLDEHNENKQNKTLLDKNKSKSKK